MADIQRISPCLWFDDRAEEAATFYTSIFDNSRIVSTVPYSDDAARVSGRPPGSVMLVVFELDGLVFTALNGGPVFTFTEAISFQILCDTQEEIDHFWDRLSEGGDPQAQQCGWLKDRFGLSWQVVPRILGELLQHAGGAAASRVGAAILTMKKLDIAAIRAAAEAG